MRKLLLTASLVALAGPALAQGGPMPPQAMPFPPAAPGAPIPQRPVAAPIQPSRPDLAPPMPGGPAGSVAVSNPAPMPAQPEGGFGATPPVPGAADPAQRMTLQGAEGYKAEMARDAGGRLDQMMGAKGPAEADLPNAPISSQSDLDQLTKRQRSIVTLEQQVKEAKLAVELWGVLYNNEHAKAWREEEKKDREAKAKAEEAKSKEAMAQAATINAGQAMASAMRTPVMPQVVEVVGGRALLLVQGAGEVWAKVGTALPNGFKVVSVRAKAVEVAGPSGRQTLGFGSSVSAPAAPAMPSPSPAITPMAPRL